MNNFYASATIILSEISIVLLILFVSMLFLYLRYILGDRKAVSAFTKRVRNSEDERKDKFKKLLKNNYNYDESKLDEAAEKLTNSENEFYKALTDIYLTKKVTALDSLDKNIEELASSYHRLIPDSGISSEKMTQTISQLNAEIDKLKDENVKLGDELTKLNEEMETTVNEYASAYSSAQNASADALGKNNAPSEPQENPEESVAEESRDSSDIGTASDGSLKEINLDMDEDTDDSAETVQETAEDISSTDNKFKEINLEMDDESGSETSAVEESIEDGTSATEPTAASDEAGETIEITDGTTDNLQDIEISPESEDSIKPSGETHAAITEEPEDTIEISSEAAENIQDSEASPEPEHSVKLSDETDTAIAEEPEDTIEFSSEATENMQDSKASPETEDSDGSLPDAENTTTEDHTASDSDATEKAEQTNLPDTEPVITSDEKASEPDKEIPSPIEDNILDPSRIETTEIEHDEIAEKSRQKEDKGGGLLNPPPVTIRSKEEKLKRLLNEKSGTKTESDIASEPPQDKQEPGSDLEDILNEIDLELDESLDESIDESQDDSDSNSDLGNILKDIDLNENIDDSEGGGILQSSENKQDTEASAEEEEKET